MFNQPPPSGTFPMNGRSPMQANAGTMPQGPMAQPQQAQGSGFMGLQPGGYRGGPGIGRGAIDFSSFPGAQNGAAPMMTGQTSMAPGQQLPSLGAAPLGAASVNPFMAGRR